MRKTELLIPAGSLDVLKTAVIYGADAVYLGGEAFGLRAKAKNFTNEEIMEGIKFAHDHGVKVYITANILAHNDDLPGVEAYFEELKTIRPDALIISDPGVFTIAKRVLPDMEIHISTQANNTNYGTYLFWHELGAKRVVSARELSLKRSVHTSRRTWRSRALSTAPCASPIPEDVCSATSLRGATRTRVPVPIRAAGNIPLSRRQDRASTCRSMRMSAELISSIPRISA